VSGLHATGASIGRASAEAQSAREAGRTAIEQARGERRAVHVVDCILDVVEEINLSEMASPEQETVIGEWLLWLDHAIDVPVPVPVRSAGNATALHDALLDWQDELLDDVTPSRAAHQAADRELAMAGSIDHPAPD
jgi:hypothetical protein